MRTLASSPLPANAIQLQYGPCSCYAPTPPPLLYIFPSCPPPSPGLFRLESQRTKIRCMVVEKRTIHPVSCNMIATLHI